jgi:PAS domain S-box-containing protein
MSSEITTIINRLKSPLDTSICDSLGSYINIQKRDLKIIYQNKMSKYFLGDQVGNYCYKVYNGNGTICEVCPVLKTFEDGNIHKGESCIHSDNKTSYFEITALPLYDDSEKIIAVIESMRDITLRKQIEHMLQTSEKKNRDIMNNAPVGIMTADLNGNLLYVNEQFLKMTAYKCFEEIKRYKLQELYNDHTFFESLKTKKQIKEYELELITKTGKIKNVIINANVDIQGMSAFIIEFTKRKKAEEILRRNCYELKDRIKSQTLELSRVKKKLTDEIKEQAKQEKFIKASDKKLRINSKKLKEKSIAIKILIKQFEEEKKELERNILSNIKFLVKPYIEKLKKNKLMTNNNVYLDIIESNLNQVGSPLSSTLSSILGFTPHEILISELIREGRQDKEIMEILETALDTVKTHRKNIRKKLGIYGKRTNLRDYLFSHSMPSK